jgi:hypothetical protein
MTKFVNLNDPLEVRRAAAWFREAGENDTAEWLERRAETLERTMRLWTVRTADRLEAAALQAIKNGLDTFAFEHDEQHVDMYRPAAALDLVATVRVKLKAQSERFRREMEEISGGPFKPLRLTDPETDKTLNNCSMAC